MFIALDKLHNQGLRQAIIVMPEKSIGASLTTSRCPDSASGPTVKQVAVADRMLLTKSDLTSPRDLAKLRNRLAAINPGAEIREGIRGDAGPSDLIGSGRYHPESKTPNVQEWLRAEESKNITIIMSTTMLILIGTMIEYEHTVSRGTILFHQRGFRLGWIWSAQCVATISCA